MSNERRAGQAEPGRRRLSGGFAALCVVLIVVFQALAPPPAAGAPSSTTTTTTSSAGLQGILTIDGASFFSSVPSSATLGQNYTLRVLIESSSNLTLPIIVRVLAPVETILIHPLVLRTDLAPMGSLVANFSIVPFVSWNKAPINVTAAAWVWFINQMSTPRLVAQTTAYIYTIGGGSPSYLNVLVFAAVVAVVLAVVAVTYRYSHRRGATA